MGQKSIKKATKTWFKFQVIFNEKYIVSRCWIFAQRVHIPTIKKFNKDLKILYLMSGKTCKTCRN